MEKRGTVEVEHAVQKVEEVHEVDHILMEFQDSVMELEYLHEHT